MDSVARRLKEALEIRNMKQSELSKATGIGKSSISTYLAGNYRPKQDNIMKMAKALNVSEEWLNGRDAPIDPPTGIRSAKYAYDKMTAMEVYLSSLGWKMEAEDSGSGRVLFSDGVTSFWVSPEDYASLANDATDFFLEKLQKLAEKSFNRSMENMKNRR